MKSSFPVSLRTQGSAARERWARLDGGYGNTTPRAGWYSEPAGALRKSCLELSARSRRCYLRLALKLMAICLGMNLLLAGAGRAAPTYVAIPSPAKGATVRGTITIITSETADISWIEVFIDRNWLASKIPAALRSYRVSWNSTGVVNGRHMIWVRGYGPNDRVISIAGIPITVSNHRPTPTPTPRYTARRTPTPTPVVSPATCVRIMTPLSGAAVRGLRVAVGTRDSCPGRWFESLYIDGSHVGDFPPGAVVLNSTRLSNGRHTVAVRSQSRNPGSHTLGSSAESLLVENGAATPTPTAGHRVAPTSTRRTSKPTPTGKVTPTAHLGNLAPKAALPAESTCATLANQSNFPETTPENVNDGTGWNANNQIWTTPSYFYTNAGRDGLAPAVDFAAVNGHYSGSTQDIIRWAACKWGVDEDWAYAETAQETGGWTNACAQMHGGSSCHEGGDCGNPDSNSGGESPDLSFLGFPVTNSSGAFVGTSAYGGQNADGSTCSSTWASWSIIQSKANSFEWYAWPMLAISTAWGEDYRWAKYRACVNGDYATWFGNPSDYLNAVIRARSNPNGIVPSGQAGPVNLFTNETNMQYLGLGCIGTHFSGNWYDSGADNYLTNGGSGFLYHLNSSNWPGGRR